MGKRAELIIFYSFISIFLLILFSEFSHAVKIGVSPGSLEFKGREGNEICNKIMVYSDKEENIALDLKWSEKESKKINDYNVESKDLGINEEFEKEFVLYESGKKEICLNFNKQGVYNGLLIIMPKGMSAGVGVWIKAVILKGSSDNYVRQGVSWNEIQDGIISFRNDNLNEQKIAGLLILVNFELFLMLAFLVLTKMAINRTKVL